MRVLRLFVCCLLFLIAVFAQSDRGTLTGTVADPANAMVPGAKIILKNMDTGAQYDSATTATGNYTIPSLPTGRYELSVEAAGFTKYIQQGITISVAQTSRQDVTLKVGSTSESVTISADAPLLRTEGAQQSIVVTNQQVDALPLPRVHMRNPLDFATFAPGVTGTAGQAGGSSIRVNGSPATTYKILVDGQDITSSIDPSHSLEQQPSVDALAEFTLQTSNFAAEFGQVAGGLFNLTSRSGTNQYHGTVFAYPRNEWLNAGRAFTATPEGKHTKSRVRNYNFGGSVGGPVYIPKVYNGRDKTFFFFNLERYIVRGMSTGTYATLPTADYRAGNFSAALGAKALGTDPLGRSILENMIYDPKTQRPVNGQVLRDPFTNNTIPNNSLYMDPVAQNIQKLMPGLASGRESMLINNFEQRYRSREDRDIPSIKVDHNIGTKSKASFYWSRYRYYALARADGLTDPLTGSLDRKLKSHTFRFTYDYTLTPTMLLHFGAGYVRWTNHDVAIQQEFDYPAASPAPTGIGLVGGLTSGFPNMTIGTGAANKGGMSIVIGAGNGSLQYDDKPTGVLSATYIRGNHSYKAGTEWKRDIWAVRDIRAPIGTYSFNAAQTALPYLATTSIGGSTIGFPYASFLLGAVNTASVSNLSDPRWKKAAWGLYVQDTWKVNRKLTLDYGMRWDYQQAPTEVHYRDSMFGPTIPNPSAGGLLGGTVYEGYGPGRCNCKFTNTYPFAIGPRLGVAYQLNSKTVIRGGWGISYGNPNNYSYIGASLGVGYNTMAFSSGNFGDPGAVLKTGLVYNPADLNVITLDPGIRPQAGQINSPSTLQDRNAGRPPRINQWNISAQRELTRDIVVEAAYVGNRGAWYEANSLIDLNALTPQRLASFGLDINNAVDRTLLNSTIGSAAAAARGFKVPYAGYPTGQTVAQTLRPYPQFGTLGTRWSPLGRTWYDGLQTKFTKRFSHGLNASSAFTWQKELTNMGAVNDVFNRDKQKALASASLPFMFINAVSYKVPFVGSNKLIKMVTGGWEIGAYLRYMSGGLIQVPGAQSNLNLYLFRNTFANRVPGQPLFLTDINGKIDPNKQFVLNPAAWSDPGQGQWGQSAIYYNDYRARRTPDESMNFGRVFRITEGTSLEVRVEFSNVFNRLVLPGPSSGNALAAQAVNAQGVPTAGFGYISTSGGVGGNRSGQFHARFRF